MAQEYKVLTEEQEVSISFDKMGENCILYTTDYQWVKKMDKLCEDYPDSYKCDEIHKLQSGEVIGKTYSFPKKLITLRKPYVRNESSEAKEKRMKNLKKK